MQGMIRASGHQPGEPASPYCPGASRPTRLGYAWLCTPEADGLVGQELDIRTDPFRRAARLEPLA
jgi:hypothetical protein